MKCCFFHNFIFLCSINTFFINRALKLKYQPGHLKVKHLYISLLQYVQYILFGLTWELKDMIVSYVGHPDACCEKKNNLLYLHNEFTLCDKCCIHFTDPY